MNYDLVHNCILYVVTILYYKIKRRVIMRKHLMLIVSIFLFIVSIIFLVIGMQGDNNTAIHIGLVLLIIVNLFNIVRGLINMLNEGK